MSPSQGLRILQVWHSNMFKTVMCWDFVPNSESIRNTYQVELWTFEYRDNQAVCHAWGGLKSMLVAEVFLRKLFTIDLQRVWKWNWVMNQVQLVIVQPTWQPCTVHYLCQIWKNNCHNFTKMNSRQPKIRLWTNSDVFFSNLGSEVCNLLFWRVHFSATHQLLVPKLRELTAGHSTLLDHFEPKLNGPCTVRPRKHVFIFQLQQDFMYWMEM